MSSTLRKRKRNEREKGEEHSDAESQASNMSNFDNLSYQEERHCVVQQMEIDTQQRREPWKDSLDAEKLFEELIYARFRVNTYQLYSSWGDDRLWQHIIRTLFPQLEVQMLPSPVELLAHIIEYKEKYENQPLSFGCSVRQKMEVVFKSEVNLGPLKADLKIDRDEKQLGALIVHNHSTGNVDLQYIGRYIARSSKIAEKFPEEDVAVIEDYMCRHPACAYMFIELDNEGKEKFYRSRLSKLDRFLESSSGSSSGCSSEKKRSKRYRA